jgi:aryl-alcohol dehydrogenase-like predicted oxidoreductase
MLTPLFQKYFGEDKKAATIKKFTGLADVAKEAGYT